MKIKLWILSLLLSLSVGALAQSQMVKGLVADDSGESLVGVSIVVKGTTRGAITDFDGKYAIDGLGASDILVFSFIGYKAVEKTVGTNQVIDVVLQFDTETLGEVQVVAFQKQKKESVIGSINTIQAKELKQPTSNLTNSLAGRIAGVIAYQRSGEPGADNAAFFIRGVTSFGYASSPLILLDGVEVSSSDLARIEPDNIASFSIMKDATATSLYGARGANGVILITTKEGVQGKMKVSARVETSLSMPTRLNGFVDGVSYMEMYNEAIRTRNPNASPKYSKEKIENTRQGTNPFAYPNVDWYNELFKDYTINKRANVNASGGGEIAQYYLSVSYNNETGILNVDPTNNFNNNINIDRYNLRANVDFKISRTTKASVKFYSLFEQYNGPAKSATDIFNSVMQANPVDFPLYYPKTGANEVYKYIFFGNIGNGDQVNPYANMVSGYQDSFSSNILSQFKIEQELDFITEGLSARGLASIKNYSSYGSSRSYSPFFFGLSSYDQLSDQMSLYPIREGTEYLGNPTAYTNANSTSYFELATMYNRTFGKHELGALLVGTAQERLNTTPGNNVYASLPARNMGVSGRATYGFDSRYYLEANFGYNGSERFSRDYRFGFFPSVGLAWSVANEAFWKGLKPLVPTLKVRATYGLVGNDAIASDWDRFLYLSNVNLEDPAKGFTWGKDFQRSYPGYSITRYPNPDVTWEIAEKINIGLEMNILDKINLQVDFFKENRDNIYMENQYVPDMIGWGTTVHSNVGKAESQGCDLSLDYQEHFGPDFWVSSRMNFTYATNKVVQNGEPEYPFGYMSQIGQPINQQWGLVAERLFIDAYDVANSPKQTYGSNYGAGDIKYVDVNKDGKIDDTDRVAIGFPTTPEIVYGFGLSMGYKAFDLSFFLQGTANTSFFIDPKTIEPFVNERNALSIVADNYWSNSNPDPHAFWPRLSTGEITNNNQVSTWWLRDGSFLRMKSVELGYTLPPNVLNRVKLKSMRVYFSGNNLFTLSSFKMWDPEMGGNGLGYPPQVVYNLGLSISL